MITANIMGGLVEAAPIAISSGSITDIYEAKSNEVICAGFCIANTTGSPVAVLIYRQKDATDVLIWEKSIPANDTVIETEIPLKLREGYKVRAQAANGVNITPMILRLG